MMPDGAGSNGQQQTSPQNDMLGPMGMMGPWPMMNPMMGQMGDLSMMMGPMGWMGYGPAPW
jgi:hypothetical protein